MNLRFDFATDDTTTGYRLEYFEFYNWGTYNKKIIKLNLDKQNALLTGDIGSGKSTIVDALTTLLVPTQKITYNKAAGANAKERTLYSYIVGEYKTTQDENFGRAKAVALRDESSFSVLLAKFGNEGYDEHIFLAQFFYIANKQVQRFFITSKGKLDLKKDFFNFKDIRELKKRLKTKEHTFVYDTFKEYSKYFRKEMGLRSEQALNLFYQTVSLKAIGNLTEFIRTHMLEDFKIDDRIEEICQNFAELNHTHNLVLKAKREIELLSPISKEYKKYQNFESEKALFTSLRELINCYVSYFEKELLKTKIKELSLELQKANSKQKIQQQELEEVEKEIISIKIELEKSGASRINDIDKEIQNLSNILLRVKEANKTYNEIVKSLGFSAVSNEHRFLTTKDEFQNRFDGVEEEKIKLQNSIMMNEVALQKYKEQKKELEIEVIYLQNNPSNIPAHISKIRDKIANSLNIDREQLPFIGELVKVKDISWSGAIERVLHNSALSILVDSKYYKDVSDYIDNTNLKGKIIYLHIQKDKKESKYIDILPHSLLNKIEVKVDSDFFDATVNILQDRFNIPCVENMDEFRRYKKALSINGQFKASFTRHEKDDRFDINDKSRWVLGWENLEKLKEFQNRLEALEQKIEFLQNQTQDYDKELKKIETTRDKLRDALKFKSFEEIDWYRYSKKIEELESEKSELLKSSNIIKTLQDRLSIFEIKAKEFREKNDAILRKLGSLENEKEKRDEELNRAILILNSCEISNDFRKRLDSIKEFLGLKINLNTISTSKTKLREHIQSKVDSISKKANLISQNIISLQNNYKKEFQVESKEFLIDIQSCNEYIKRLEILKKDNLPKWESKFKRLFKEKSIQDIVMLQSQLEELSKQITNKIETINLSLRDIEYSDGTFIELIAAKSKNKEIKEFKEKLKGIVSGAIDEENEYNEEKFKLLKELIDRFNGREGKSELDKKWRKFVSDVRNWYEFSAAEKYISDGKIKEYYEDSGGKSGGQKEKLAYTVLASSLAYQFGVEHDKIQSRSFRFVMIDEAFGRGSDESSRYALRLFEKLKLQLLVITPKQKINVIEPFVKSVHFVSNKDGMDSSLVSLSIEEYKRAKS